MSEPTDEAEAIQAKADEACNYLYGCTMEDLFNSAGPQTVAEWRS